ncbi:hypothetical protein FSARC_12909 [Fusarium sarcochroum]|uniref:Glucose-methanol-choline oxidoreductase N-terminal domain-containing protein n=1 Tax=Fusarium sarcochroum TaxID=1208366 RepID=A0A8H4WVK3_9HYPO|nr:hypothetical protein FSARC_12909 [Fusarium sarcochroum]
MRSFFLSACTSLALVHHAASLDLPNPVLSPLSDSISSLLKGDGLAEGTLGAIGGTLGKNQEFDYLVAGGGTAGNAIGTRLAQAGYKVAIIEAGGFYEISKPVLSTAPGGDIIGTGSSTLDSIPTVDWVFETEPQAGANNRKFHYARGKCLGGSSALNFMIYHRGSTGTYDRWADLVGDDSYRLKNFQAYFKNSTTFTPPNTSKRISNATAGTKYIAEDFKTKPDGGPVQVSYTFWVSAWATWLEKGLKAVGLKSISGFNSGELLGYHYTQTTIDPKTAARSSSTEYIYKAKSENLDNLKVFTRTQAAKVLFDNDKKANGLEVSFKGVKYTLKAKREVILSAGAFQSPQLLMVSGIGPKETLDKFDIEHVSVLEGVGQNMWDHIFFGPSYQVNFQTLNEVLRSPLSLVKALTQYALTKSGPLTSNIIEFIGWEKLPEKYRTNFSPETKKAFAEFPADWPEVEYLGANGFLGNFEWPILQQPLDGKQYATMLGAMVAPISRGNVTIASASGLDKPIINPNWLTAKADQEAAIAWFRRMRDVWATKELKSISIGSEYWPGKGVQTDEEVLDMVRDSLMTVWHAACTCKMGKKGDKMAVVDSFARVFGVEGLRVVDASSMALLPPGHPQSTIYAFAEKIADDIIKQRK